VNTLFKHRVFDRFFVLFWKTLTLVLLLVSSTSTNALDQRDKSRLKWENEFNFFIEGALHKGTDDTRNIPFYDRNTDVFFNGLQLAVVGDYTGAGDGLTFADKIEAGGYFRGSFGAEFPLAENLLFSTSIGILYDEITGELQDGSGGEGFARFQTTQVDFIGFYLYERHRFGLGGSFHYRPKFDYKELGQNFEMHAVYRFSSALGASAQYDYLLSKSLSLGIRYTYIEYDFNKVRVDDFVGELGDTFVADCTDNCSKFIDASSISAHFTYRF